MKKKILILICVTIFILTKYVNAETGDYKIYFGNYISNVYINKIKNGTIYYEQSRFIRTVSGKKHVYCLDPFIRADESKNYTNKGMEYRYLNISKDTWNTVVLLAYYGYGYPGHTTDKWYGITQFMIWKTIYKNNIFYFTDKLNGTKTDKYKNEINELNRLIKKHNLLPSFNGNKNIISINSNNVFIDVNKVLNDFNITNSNGLDINISQNSLIVNTKDETNINITLEKKFNLYNNSPSILIANDTQNILIPGNVNKLVANMMLEIISGKLKITKVDFDTNSTIPSGEGKLVGSKYGIYNSDYSLINTLTIGDNNEGIIESLKFGKYIIKEIESMVGYNLDQNEYEILIDKDNLNIDLVMKNKAIKSQLVINKYTEDNVPEENITFGIYDYDNNLVNYVTTNNEGIATIELYYGKYIIKQINSIKNYLKAEDIELIIDSNEDRKINIYNKKFSSHIKIVKKDKENKNIITDKAIFKIYDLQCKCYIKDGNSINLVLKDGIYNTKNKLVSGKYILEEVMPPIGYKSNEGNIEFIIDDESTSINNSVLEIIVYNSKLNKLVVEVPDTYSSKIDKKVLIFCPFFLYKIKSSIKRKQFLIY